MSFWIQTYYDNPDQSTSTPPWPKVQGVPWYQDTVGDWLWTDGTDWYSTPRLGPDIYYSTSYSTPKQGLCTNTWNVYNGYLYFEITAGRYLWYDTIEGWVISDGVGTCINEAWYEPTMLTVEYDGDYHVYDVTIHGNIYEIIGSPFSTSADASTALACSSATSLVRNSVPDSSSEPPPARFSLPPFASVKYTIRLRLLVELG